MASKQEIEAPEFDADALALFNRGQTAWRAIKRQDTWEAWKEVGQSLVTARDTFMRKLQLNEPTGRAYSTLMGDWLKRYGFHDIHKTTRSQLYNCMDNLGAIEHWREQLRGTDLKKWLAMNNPAVIWRSWPDNPKSKMKQLIDSHREDPKDKVIAELQGVIDEHENTIAARDQTIADKDQTIADKDQTIADQQRAIRELKDQAQWDNAGKHREPITAEGNQETKNAMQPQASEASTVQQPQALEDAKHERDRLQAEISDLKVQRQKETKYDELFRSALGFLPSDVKWVWMIEGNGEEFETREEAESHMRAKIVQSWRKSWGPVPEEIDKLIEQHLKKSGKNVLNMSLLPVLEPQRRRWSR